MDKDLENKLREILTEAIEKAIAGGWGLFNHSTCHWRVEEYDVAEFSEPFVRVYHIEQPKILTIGLGDVIFNHDFAKALWGDGDPDIDRDDIDRGIEIHDWQWHLQQMVIAPDPIEWLGKQLNGPQV